MIILASDTSTSMGSVALLGPEGKVLVEDLDRDRPHSETLLPCVEQILGRAGLTREDVQAIAVGTGPGAFTGLRVGLATFKAWAAASGLPLIPVVSLDAVALPFLEKGNSAAVLADARKGEVYAAYYPSLDERGLPRREGEVVLISQEQVPDWLSSLEDPDVYLAGTAIAFLAEKGLLGEMGSVGHGNGSPDAGFILSLAQKLLSLGLTVDPPGLVPMYVRPPDADPPSPGTIVTASPDPDSPLD